YSEVSTGAHNDLERATEIARLMVTKYGMSERVGLATFGERTPLFLKGMGIGGERDYSEETARAIDAEVRAILDRTDDRVRGILATKKATLVAAARELKRVETLEGEPLRPALGRGGGDDQAGHHQHQHGVAGRGHPGAHAVRRVLRRGVLPPLLRRAARAHPAAEPRLRRHRGPEGDRPHQRPRRRARDRHRGDHA